LFALGVKSLIGYRKSQGQLAKYMAWFGFVFVIALLAFSIPSSFTLNPSTLRITYLVGEFFFFGGMVTQAAILWCLVLRPYFSIYHVTLPVAALGLVSWLYDVPHSRLSLSHNFITYLDTRFSTWVIVVMMIGLFVPVGLYFIRATAHQIGPKATVTSFVLGMMYAGFGLSAASQELISGQIVSPSSAITDIIISAMLLIALVLPWQLSVRLPGQVESLVPHNRT
jgi:hypothetical protein